jgi:Fe-S cluster assembly protein SufD
MSKLEINDLIRQVGVPSIEERLLKTVEAELAKNVLKDLGSIAAFGQDS